MNVITWLEFELTHFEPTVQNFSYYAPKTPHLTVCIYTYVRICVCRGRVMDSFIGTCKCWPTNKNLSITSLYRHRMQSRKPTGSDGSLRRMTGENQANLCKHRDMMRMKKETWCMFKSWTRLFAFLFHVNPFLLPLATVKKTSRLGSLTLTSQPV